jgi:hypothetical protein
MNKRIMRVFSLLVFLVVVFQLKAQEESSPWSYNVGAGVAFRFPNTYGPELNNLLSRSSVYPQVASNVALGLDYRISEKLSLGVQTQGFLFPKVETNVSKVTLAGASAGLKGAYKVIDNIFTSADAYLGIGVYHTTSTISNDGFLVNKPPLFIPPGKSQQIAGQITYLDFGAQAWRHTAELLDWSLSAGYMTRLASSSWKSSWGAPVDVLSFPALSLLYLRVSAAIRKKE